MRAGSAAWVRRTRKAFLLLLAGCLSPLLIGSLLEEGALANAPADDGGFALQEAGEPSAAARDLLGDDADLLPFELFSLFSGFSAYEQGVLPEGFAGEVIDPADYGCSQPTWSGGIVGMVCPGRTEEVLDAMREDLASRGWSLASEGGQGGCLSFVKGSGEYRWLFVSGSTVASSSSVWMAFSREGDS